MARNIAEDYTGEGGLPSRLADCFIENIRIRLTGCGLRTIASERVNVFTLPAFLAVFQQSGSAEIRHGAETTVLQPDSLFIFRPYDSYSGKRIGGAAVRFAYVQFDIAPFLERYRFGLCTLSSPDAIFQSDRYRRIGSMIAELAAEDGETAGRTGMLQLLTKLLIAQIIYDEAKRGPLPAWPQKGREPAVVSRAYQYTADHLSEPIRIGKILSCENISKATLEKAFRKTFSVTPRQALLRFKIERSMEMLQYNTPIGGIVKALGFSSTYHYSNAFKTVTGMRPTDYRKQIAGGRVPPSDPRHPEVPFR